MPDTHPHAHISPPPHYRKRFHTEDMRRIPVEVTPLAQACLDQSSYQGRVLPQALSEFFGTLPDVDQVSIELTEDRLKITIRHKEERKQHAFHIETAALTAVSDQPRAGFEAVTMADELLRLYRTYVLREED
jgi:hypothetical protein